MAVLELPEWTALAPALILAGTALVLFLLDSINPRSTNRALLAGTAVAGSLSS
ncbi:NADH-quinone oxidoreductase subunit N, partial [Natrinema soli]